VDTMEHSKRAPRRRHADELKARVLVECAKPGASVAQVALSNGLNANLVHKWRRQGSGSGSAVAPLREANAFIPLALPAAAEASDIRIELRRGAVAVHLTWPVTAATQCAAWLREVLK
jgi:transposase